jgi:hypothetical protein
MREHGDWVALVLVLLQIALVVWLLLGERENRPRIKQFIAASSFNVLMIAFFWLGNRITEITFSKVGSIKAQVEQASAYVDDIKKIRTEVEHEQQIVNAAAQEAKNAKQLSEDLRSKNIQASKELSALEIRLSEATKTSERLQTIAQYTTTVLAAQNDDRAAFDQLQAWSKNKSFPLAPDAGRAWSAIEASNETLMLDYSVPWKSGTDPGRLNLVDLHKDYESSSIPSVRIAIVQYIAKRSDIPKKERLRFLVDVMQHDPSLKVVTYAGQSFGQLAQLNPSSGPFLKFPALSQEYFYKWWKDNASKVP